MYYCFSFDGGATRRPYIGHWRETQFRGGEDFAIMSPSLRPPETAPFAVVGLRSRAVHRGRKSRACRGHGAADGESGRWPLGRCRLRGLSQPIKIQIVTVA